MFGWKKKSPLESEEYIKLLKQITEQEIRIVKLEDLYMSLKGIVNRKLYSNNEPEKAEEINTGGDSDFRRSALGT